MCGGSDEMPGREKVKPVPYEAPTVRDLDRQFRETGRVPYSYYGQGSPTTRSELDAVMSAYPDAFPEGVEPEPARRSPFELLFQALRNFGNT